MHLFMSALPVLNLSVDNLLAGLVVLIIAIVLFVACWGLVKPFLGQFANLVLALFVVIVILVIAKFLGIF